MGYWPFCSLFDPDLRLEWIYVVNDFLLESFPWLSCNSGMLDFEHHWAVEWLQHAESLVTILPTRKLSKALWFWFIGYILSIVTLKCHLLPIIRPSIIIVRWFNTRILAMYGNACIAYLNLNTSNVWKRLYCLSKCWCQKFKNGKIGRLISWD